MAITNKLPFDESMGVYLPGAEIKYWVKFPENYSEEFTNNAGNSTVARIYIPWEESASFKIEAMGYTIGESGEDRFNRTTPMRCPYTTKQYLQSMRLTGLYTSQDQLAAAAEASPDPVLLPFARDPVFGDWPTAGWAEYELIFQTLPYPVLSDSELTTGSGVIPELARYVRKTRRTVVQERRLPSLGFETCEVSSTVIQEVGFVPYTTEEIIYTLYQVPLALVPDTAISNCGACVNDTTFDGKAAGTMLFKGLAAPIDPYGGPSGELYVNLMYNFGYNAQTWYKYPVGVDGSGNTVYKRIRKYKPGVDVGTTNDGEPMYGKADFAGLFKPLA